MRGEAAVVVVLGEGEGGDGFLVANGVFQPVVADLGGGRRGGKERERERGGKRRGLRSPKIMESKGEAEGGRAVGVVAAVGG
ncbi:hypothetical protein HAX54_050008, partial [Datura stramonium]|nr:hypothetical protein [Datura stramonium]